jgi:hypothetical protein
MMTHNLTQNEKNVSQTKCLMQKNEKTSKTKNMRLIALRQLCAVIKATHKYCVHEILSTVLFFRFQNKMSNETR